LPNRIRDHQVELVPIGQGCRPGQQLAFPERPQLLRRHDGLAEAPDVLEDVDAIVQRAGRVVGMAEHDKACLVGFVGRDRIGAGNPLIVLREPCEIRFVEEPIPHRLANFGVRGAFRECRTASAVEEPRKIDRVLTLARNAFGAFSSAMTDVTP
jgi:hypothetical protein